MKNITLALATIVKNEESSIERLLESVKNDADEIVLVDTGSTDKTIEIARSFGATVLERPWDSNFSAARNFGLDNVKSDWIIILDADEELHTDSRGKVKEVIHSCTECEGYNVYVENFGLETIFSNVRLFKQRAQYRYVGAVHEAITSLIDKEPLVVKQSNLTIVHYGYSLDKNLMEEKDTRNKGLINNRLKVDPSDPLNKYYLASMKVEYDNDAAGAIKICEEILEGPQRNLSVDVQTLSMYTELLSAAGSHSKVIAAIRKRPELMNYNPTISFQYALSSVKLGQLDEAIMGFDFCLNYDYSGLSFGLIPKDLKKLAQENLKRALLDKKKQVQFGK